jgi:diaminobutyrate-2-oxoglutarate transaminase
MAIGPPIKDIHYDGAPDVGTVPGPGAKRLLERQQQVDSSAVAYPKDLPLAFESARGATVRDVDGNTFLDFFGGIGVLNVGHANPYVVEGVSRQLETLVHTIDFPTEVRLDLIERLEAIAPGDLAGNSRVVFGGPTGSDAIEAAIKLAKYNTGGHGLIAFRGSYHGATSGAMSLTSNRAFKKHYTPLLPDVVHAPFPNPFRQGCSPSEAVDDALAEVRGVVEDPYGGLANPAGIFVEPIQGEGGVIVPPDGFLAGLREIADDNGLTLVFDEIQSGLGRTGEWFACDWYEVTPDVVTSAKALGGIGLPLSGTIYHESLDTWGPGDHAGTYRGHVLGMRAGLRALEYIESHDLLAHARRLGERFLDRLEEATADIPFRVDVRGKGLFIGVEFLDDEGRPAAQLVDAIQQGCFERGLLVWTAGQDDNVLRLLPPLVLTEEQAEVGLDIIAEIIDSLAGSG